MIHYCDALAPTPPTGVTTLPVWLIAQASKDDRLIATSGLEIGMKEYPSDQRQPYRALLEEKEALMPGAAPKDTDRDGMPDDWEKKNGLYPANDDFAKVMPGNCTTIEVYM